MSRTRCTQGATFRAALPSVLVTSDGVAIEALHEPGPEVRRDLAIIVAHGFTGSWRGPSVRAVAAGLHPHGGVLSFDFRGQVEGPW